MNCQLCEYRNATLLNNEYQISKSNKRSKGSSYIIAIQFRFTIVSYAYEA